MSDNGRVQVVSICAMIPLVALSSCKPTPHRGVQLHPTAQLNYGIPPCSPPLPPSPTAPEDQVAVVVRAYIPGTGTHLDTSQMPRKITYRPHIAGADENQFDGPLLSDLPVSDIYAPNAQTPPNPYHMDLSKLPKLIPSKLPPYIEIRFILLDGETPGYPHAGSYTFYGSFTDDNRNPLPGLGVDYGGSAIGWCGGSIIKAGTDANYPAHDVAVVYVPMRTGALKSGSYSIILLPNQNGDTPIFIDPKVINNG